MPTRLPTLLRVTCAATLGLALSTAAALADGLPVIELTVQDGHFVPETVQVPAHRKFRLQVTNKGQGPEEFESSDLNREKIVAAGHHIFLFLGPLEPGRYRFFGDFHTDTAHGVLDAR